MSNWIPSREEREMKAKIARRLGEYVRERKGSAKRGELDEQFIDQLYIALDTTVSNEAAGIFYRTANEPPKDSLETTSPAYGFTEENSPVDGNTPDLPQGPEQNNVQQYIDHWLTGFYGIE